MKCLVALTKIHHKPNSAEVLAYGLPFEPGEDKPRLFSIKSSRANFSRAADKAGFVSKLLKRKLEDISSLVMPVILTLRNEDACVLLDIDFKKHTATVILPEISEKPVQVELKKLEEEYLGYAFFLSRKYEGFLPGKFSAAVLKNKNWFFGTMMRFKGIYARVLLASLLTNVFVIAGPMFTLNVYDRVIPHNAVDTLWVLAAGVGTIYLFDLILKHIRTYFLENAARRSDVILSSMLFEQALSLKLENKPRSVGAFSSVIKDFDGVRNFFASSAISAFIDLPFACIFLMVIYWINHTIVLIPVATILVILAVSIPMRFAIQKQINTTHEATHHRNGILVESLSNLEIIKAFNAASSMQWHWEENSGFIAEKTQKLRVRSGSLSTITAFLNQVSSVGIIIAGVYLIREQELTMGGLIAVNILASRAIAPMAQAISLLLNSGQMKAVLKSLKQFMELEIERPENKEFLHRTEVKGEIEFKDVSFAYPGEQNPAISGISFHIKQGERVGIIGAVGSGKSTIGRLLLALFEPTGGAIFLDGIDIKQIDPVDLRGNFAYVPQDVVLFSGRVRDNIALSSPHADDEQILNAAEIGGVTNFTDRHPMGMDLQVGERGGSLSGGQRQSVAVAMAFVEKNPIILLDEPTNAMDFATEAQVIKKLEEETKGWTSIVITHKPSILSIVDRLIVIDKGRLVMDGPKDEILKKLGGNAA